MVLRHAVIGLLAVLSAVGCRAAGTGDLAATHPPIAPRPALTAETVVSRINQNARLVRTLKANPEITIDSDSFKGGVSGRLAMERPRNFKMTIYGGPMQSERADIGSNDQGFWFWMDQRKPREFYTCSYEEDGASPLAVTFQPDWIVEALGLREIPSEEARSIRVEQGDGPRAGSLILTREGTSNGGEPYTKIMVVDAYTGLLRELYLQGRNGQPMASAKVTTPTRGEFREQKYRRIALPPRPGETEGSGPFVQVPNQIELEWAQEKLKLVVELGSSPKINIPIDRVVFVEPEFPGYTRVDLAERTGLASGGPTTVRESLPAPPAGHGVQLGRPVPTPINADRSTMTVDDPVPLAADLGLVRSDEPEAIIGARIPTAPEPDGLRAVRSSRWGPATRSGFEH